MSPSAPFPARKFLGQNFLIDPRVQERIITACELKADEEVIEIGPGLGHLTKGLIASVRTVYAIEKDSRLIDPLKQQFPVDKFKVYNEDVLNFNFSRFPASLKIIGNLPYNISTLILEHILSQSPQPRSCFFTVQKEFAQRLIAQPSTKDYGSLTCFVQYWSDVKILFRIAPTCFKPVPKVTSAFIRILIRPPVYPAKNPPALFKLIQTAFQQRRKKITNALSAYVPHDPLIDLLKQCLIDPHARPENLTLKNYVDLSNVLLGNLKSGLQNRV